jgi:putative transposase
MARAVVPGISHHVTQRGNGRQAIFFSDQDRRLYLELLRDFSHTFALTIWAYALMDNHVHLVAVPQREDSLARAMGRIQAEYARYLNVRRRTCGHLWQARYFSCPLDGCHVWVVMRYVEKNPVRAGMVAEADEWPWSSARAHVTGWDPEGLLEMEPWGRVYNGAQWQTALRTSLEEEGWQRRFQEATLQGRPLGSEEFVEEMELVLGRALRARRPGRPKNTDGGHGAGIELNQMVLKTGN